MQRLAFYFFHRVFFEVQHLWTHPCVPGELNVRRLLSGITTSSFSPVFLRGQVLGRWDTRCPVVLKQAKDGATALTVWIAQEVDLLCEGLT